MNLIELLKWQWKGYSQFHQNRMNLIIHIFAIPLFMLSNILFVISLVKLSIIMFGISILLINFPLILEAIGHGNESMKAIPFSSVMNAVVRLFLEQWITFPRFVISGNWYINFKKG